MQLLRKSEPAACNVRNDYRQTGNDMLMAPIPAVADNIVTCTEGTRWGRESRLCILDRQLACKMVAPALHVIIVLHFQNQVELHREYTRRSTLCTELCTLAAYFINICDRFYRIGLRIID